MAKPSLKYEQKTPPVLVLTFNRPRHLIQVLEKIRFAEPSALYFSCDGPRSGRAQDSRNVHEIRNIIERIDWCSQIRTRFHPTNLGCGKAVSDGITWFLQEAGEGIILEDDCLPTSSFFRFCGEMLDAYRHDTRIGQVAGYNLLSGHQCLQSDYHFSQFGWQWGWATWSRAWAKFDLGLRAWPRFKQCGFNRTYPFDDRTTDVLDAVYNGECNTWDYQWHFALRSNSMMSVVPRYSQVTNIGLKGEATHAQSDLRAARYAVDVKPLTFPIQHPEYVYPHVWYDRALVKFVSRKTLRERVGGIVAKVRSAL